ncbi:MAG: hypothetical protein C4560_07185 [Nitrospiraceae bacterium]|nr:MAG: hypothetical protein C4560_07185 [Nitrospiraceae bacterium]
MERKLYQLIISRLDGEKLSSASYREKAVRLAGKGIGGFILFGGGKDEVRSFIDRLQSVSEIPLFIASDIERGAGQQVAGATRFPSAMAIAAAIDRNKPNDVTILRDAIDAVADEALGLGINMPFIPVLDVNTNPDNPIICTRAFSDDPEEVAWYGGIYITGLEDRGLISCAKHFPGHGDTSIDSHMELPVISKSVKELNAVDIMPFREAVKAGVSSIMIGHLVIPAIDTLPASLSEKMITGVLRKDLGFEGLVLTDALNMSALSKLNHVPAKCINAGVDILLHPADADSVVEELKAAVASGEVEEGRIDAAVKRILRFKAKIKTEKPQINYERHAALSAMLSDKSVTLIKDPAGLLPLNNVQNVCLMFAGDEDMGKISPLRSFVPEVLPISAAQDLSRKTVIFAVFTTVAAWRGSSGIREEDIHSIKEIIRSSRHSIVISFGSPYVLRHFMEADMLIAAYDTTGQAQLSVIRHLKGETGSRGRLPVALDSKHPAV